MQAARNVVVLLWSCDDILNPASSSCFWNSTVLYDIPFLSCEMRSRNVRSNLTRACFCDSRWTEWLRLRMYGAEKFVLQLGGHVNNACTKLVGRCIRRQVCILESSMMCVYLADQVLAFSTGLILCDPRPP